MNLTTKILWRKQVSTSWHFAADEKDLKHDEKLHCWWLYSSCCFQFFSFCCQWSFNSFNLKWLFKLTSLYVVSTLSLSWWTEYAGKSIDDGSFSPQGGLQFDLFEMVVILFVVGSGRRAGWVYIPGGYPEATRRPPGVRSEYGLALYNSGMT